MEKKEFIISNEGAKWVKADFHLHSPYVQSFTLPVNTDLNDVDRLVDLYIKKLIEKEIKISAITDYQQIRGEFFKNLQAKAKEKEIYIFPGVELSVNYGKGLHILLIFDYDQDINGLKDRKSVV